MKPKFLTMSFALLMAMGTSLFSCGGDDENGDVNDCAKLSSELSSRSEELIQALTENDCDAIEKAYNEIIDLYEDGHDCDAYKNAVENSGFGTYDEYKDYLEELRDIQLSDC